MNHTEILHFCGGGGACYKVVRRNVRNRNRDDGGLSLFSTKRHLSSRGLSLLASLCNPFLVVNILECGDEHLRVRGSLCNPFLECGDQHDLRVRSISGLVHMRMGCGIMFKSVRLLCFPIARRTSLGFENEIVPRVEQQKNLYLPPRTSRTTEQASNPVLLKQQNSDLLPRTPPATSMERLVHLFESTLSPEDPDGIQAFSMFEGMLEGQQDVDMGGAFTMLAMALEKKKEHVRLSLVA